MPTVDELTVATAIADTDIFYLGKPTDPDPDRQISYPNLRANLDDYFALLAGATFRGTVNVDTDTEAHAMEVSRLGTSDSQVMAMSVGDRVARFRYTEDTTAEGTDNFGYFLFQVAGNAGETPLDILQMDHNDFLYRNREVADYGTNTNGEYVRFYNGVQVCWVSASFTSVSMSIAAAGGFRSGTNFHNWPAAFSATPIAAGVSADTDALLHLANPSTGNIGFVWWRPTSATADLSARAIGIGRWY